MTVETQQVAYSEARRFMPGDCGPEGEAGR